MVINATFNNISGISWWSVLLVEKKYDFHLYHSYLSAFFFSAGVPNGEFPEILSTD
jgi:hypothetical protein